MLLFFVLANLLFSLITAIIAYSNYCLLKGLKPSVPEAVESTTPKRNPEEKWDTLKAAFKSGSSHERGRTK